MVSLNKLKNYQMAKKTVSPVADTKAAEDLLMQAKQLRFQKFVEGYNALVKETKFELVPVPGLTQDGRIGAQLTPREVVAKPEEGKK